MLREYDFSVPYNNYEETIDKFLVGLLAEHPCTPIEFFDTTVIENLVDDGEDEDQATTDKGGRKSAKDGKNNVVVQRRLWTAFAHAGNILHGAKVF